MKQIYAGIGSRQTPSHILRHMEAIATSLALQGFVLRSGNCQGADQAFNKGANAVNPKLVELFLPWPGYEALSIAKGNLVHTPVWEAVEIAAQYHPGWQNCSDGMKALHARNVQIILGAELDQPVDFVVCWTKRGKAVGGTAMGIRVAKAYGIEVRNIAWENQESRTYLQAEFCW